MAGTTYSLDPRSRAREFFKGLVRSIARTTESLCMARRAYDSPASRRGRLARSLGSTRASPLGEVVGSLIEFRCCAGLIGVVAGICPRHEVPMRGLAARRPHRGLSGVGLPISGSTATPNAGAPTPGTHVTGVAGATDATQAHTSPPHGPSTTSSSSSSRAPSTGPTLGYGVSA